MEPILIITKTDLADPDELIANYQAMAMECIAVNQKTGQGLSQVRAAFADRTTVLLGHSGVGKSTLVNALIPDANRLTGVVNDVTGRGKHTSVSAIALALPENTGWVVDTPGVRSFGLAHVTHEDVVAGFPEFAEGVVDCPRACTHALPDASAAPECALDDFVAKGHAGNQGAVRLASLRRLIAAL
jgi:ribosome biogenesis GTPase